MKSKILIIGGGGFIGYYLCKFLFDKCNYDITLADLHFHRDMSHFSTSDESQIVKIIRADFTEQSSFDLLDKDFDYVYMLASVVGVNNTIMDPVSVMKTNSNLIFNCMEWLETTEVKKVLFSSTSEVYSCTTQYFDYSIPTDEKVPVSITNVFDPRYSYAITKIMGEAAFFHHANKHNYEITIVRYQNIFGPDMGFKHVIPHVIERFFNKEQPFRIYGHDQTRSFCYIDNAVEGTVMMMESEKSSGETFHIGSTDEITIEKLVRSVGDVMGYSGDYVSAETFPGSVDRRCPNIEKAYKLIGYSPKIHWTEGLKTSINWYVNYFENNKKSPNDGFIELDSVKTSNLKNY